MSIKPIEAMDVTKVKWMLEDDGQVSPWHMVIMPVILDFEAGNLSTNFSNHMVGFSIIEDTIYINEKPRFKILKKNAEQLIISCEGIIGKYKPVKGGTHNSLTKEELERLLYDNTWLYNGYNATFSNSSIKLHYDNGDFFRDGVCYIQLYNGEIVIIINIDGELKHTTYMVRSFDKESITLAGSPNFTKELILNKKQ